MALRMMVYLGLLYQDLLKRRELTPSGKLPPVLPLVLYNGYAPWGAAREVSELIEEVPGGLERYRPRLRYCLLDEMRMADSELESLRNLAAALFRLEKSRGPEDIQRVLAALIEWLREPGLAELRRSFTAWVLKILLPSRVRGIEFPEVAIFRRSSRCSPKAVMNWTDQWKQEGIEKGLQEGLQEGRRMLSQGPESSCGISRGASVLCPRRSGGGWRRSLRSRSPRNSVSAPARPPPWPPSRRLVGRSSRRVRRWSGSSTAARPPAPARRPQGRPRRG